MGLEIRKVAAEWEPPTQDKRHVFHREDRIHPYTPNDDWKTWRPHYDEDWLSAWRKWQFERVLWHLKRPVVWLCTMMGIFWLKSYGWPRWDEGTYPDNNCDEPKWMAYRPKWSKKERTHLQLYETVSEGTPLSPPMPDIESLAKWCSENKGIWNSTDNMTYEDWIAFCRSGGWAPSLMITPGVGVETGVEFIVRTEKDKKDVL